MKLFKHHFVSDALKMGVTHVFVFVVYFRP